MSLGTWIQVPNDIEHHTINNWNQGTQGTSPSHTLNKTLNEWRVNKKHKTPKKNDIFLPILV